MYTPLFRERVRVQGREETFVVATINYRKQYADVFPVNRPDQLETDVPFPSLYPLWHSASGTNDQTNRTDETPRTPVAGPGQASRDQVNRDLKFVLRCDTRKW